MLFKYLVSRQWSGLELNDHGRHVVAANAAGASHVCSDDLVEHVLNRKRQAVPLLVGKQVAHVFNSLLGGQAVPDAVASD